jgi:sugar lactone lactonase YvrE
MLIADIVQGLAAGVGLDLSPDGKTIYYVEWSLGELSKVDVDTGEVTTLLTGLSYPQDVEVDWDTGRIYVSERTGTIRRVWPGEGSQVIATPGGGPHQLALVKDAGQTLLYTVCFDSGKLMAIDVDAQTVATIASGLGHPIGLVMNYSEQVAYVTEQDSASLAKVSLTGGRSELYSGLVSPFYLAWNESRDGIYCVQRDPSNTLVRLDLGSPVTLHTVAQGLAWRPSGVAPNVDNSRFYVCADQKLQIISLNGVPLIEPGPAPFEVYSIEFNYDGSPAIPLKDHIGMRPIPTPEYFKNVYNLPAAYVAGTLPTIRVVFRESAGYAGGTYAIGATGNLGGVRRRHLAPVFGATGYSDPIEFELMWPLPHSVGKPSVSLDWFARRTSSPAVPAPIGSAEHKLYLTVDHPVEPWVQETPWVGALEVACGWAAGAADQDAAAEGVTKGLNSCSQLCYDTATVFGSNTYWLSDFLDLLGTGSSFNLNCRDCANAVVTLANLLGCDLFEGRMQNLWTHRFLRLGGEPAADLDWVDYAWGYHEIGWLHQMGPNEFVYDGCLQLDQDTNYTDNVHIALLPVKMSFGDYKSLLVKSGSCVLDPSGKRRPVG